MSDKEWQPSTQEDQIDPLPPAEVDFTPLQEAFDNVADSLNNALATMSMVNRIGREVGARERARGLDNHLHDTWMGLLEVSTSRVDGCPNIGIDSQELDAKLIETAALCVRWLKQRERQRREADQ